MTDLTLTPKNLIAAERVTGTDLTTLHLVVRPAPVGGDSEAYLTPFCVN